MKRRHLLAMAWLLACWPLLALAQSNSVLWDNDLLAPRKTDAYYTNGLVYHHVSDTLPPDTGRAWRRCPGTGLLSRLAGDWLIPTDDYSRFWHSWDLGQLIETPYNLRRVPPDPNDQPYAGLLYLGCNVHVRSDSHAESLGLRVGIVGPWALAEQSQNLAHRIAEGVDDARGWDWQLRNELVLNLTYDRQRALSSRTLGGRGLTFFNNVDLSLGTLLTSAATGLNVLYAADPDAVFGLDPNFLGRYPRLSPGQRLGFYAMASLQATAVARNLFLDGNTWVDSPSVGHRPLVGSAQLLLGYGLSCFALQLGLNVSTQTFDSQHLKWPTFGTLGVTWGCSE